MTKYNPNKTGKHKGLPQRKSIRLKGYDYSKAGLYFITICTQNRACLFGNIVNGEMILNDAGEMIETEWLNLKNRFPNIELHEYVTMPNHFHGILEITVGTTVGAPLVVAPNEMVAPNDDYGQPQGIAPTDKTVGEMIGAFESITTNEYIRGVKTGIYPPFDKRIWQRNYWEHIVRNENEYNRISEYIINNPQKWQNDKLNNGDGNIVMEPQTPYNKEPWMI